MLMQLCWQPCSRSTHMSTPARQKGHQRGSRTGQIQEDPSSGTHPVPAAEATGVTCTAPVPPAPALTC